LIHPFSNEVPRDVYTPVQGFLWSPDGKWLLIQSMNAIVNIKDALKWAQAPQRSAIRKRWPIPQDGPRVDERCALP